MTKTTGFSVTPRYVVHHLSPSLTKAGGWPYLGVFIGWEELNCGIDENSIPAAFTSKHTDRVVAPSISPWQRDRTVPGCIKGESFSSWCTPSPATRTCCQQCHISPSQPASKL